MSSSDLFSTGDSILGFRIFSDIRVQDVEFNTMDGILNLNKPRDLTSFDIVARVKRITGERHTGHAGTLDPLATGVLPICLGKATRIIEYLFNETKTYRTKCELGVATDSYDSTGQVIKTADASGITRERVEAVLTAFRGPIFQTPPMFSALKHKGIPLYKLAREGVEVERKSRPVQIDKLEIIDWQPPFFSLEVVCGKGTYIRSLAHDIGEQLGCGAVMTELVRTRVGPFSLEESITLEQLAETVGKGYAERYLYPQDYALQSFDALVVNHEQQCLLIHGMPISMPNSKEVKPASLSRVYNEDGAFIGMVKYDAGNQRWQPHKIFLQDCCHQKSSEPEQVETDKLL
jgi:tRNA pseudouridine55 synthase